MWISRIPEMTYETIARNLKLINLWRPLILKAHGDALVSVRFPFIYLFVTTDSTSSQHPHLLNVPHVAELSYFEEKTSRCQPTETSFNNLFLLLGKIIIIIIAQLWVSHLTFQQNEDSVIYLTNKSTNKYSKEDEVQYFLPFTLSWILVKHFMSVSIATVYYYSSTVRGTNATDCGAQKSDKKRSRSSIWSWKAEEHPKSSN